MAWRRISSFTGHRGAIYALIDGDRPDSFLSGGGDGHVVRWTMDRPDQGELVATVDEPVFALHIDKDRQALFIGKKDGGLHVLDLASKQEVRLLNVHDRGVFAIRLIPGDRLICAGGDGSISVWHEPTMELIRHIPLGEEKVRGMALSGSGSHLAVACGDGTVRVLEADLFNEVRTLSAHGTGVTAVAWHPNKPVLVSAGKDGHLRTWRTDEDFRLVQDLPAHKGAIYAIAFNGDGALCATASRDKTAKLWDAGSFDPAARLDRAIGGHAHSVNTLLWTAKGSLLTAGDDRMIHAWTA